MNIRKSELDKLELLTNEIMSKAKAGQQEIEKEREILSVQQTALDCCQVRFHILYQSMIYGLSYGFRLIVSGF